MNPTPSETDAGAHTSTPAGRPPEAGSTAAGEPGPSGPGEIAPPPGLPLAQTAAAAAADGVPTQDERVASALAHVLALASVVVAPILVTGLIFLVWRRRSAYVRFQAAQAFVYQVLLAALATTMASAVAAFRPLVCLAPLALAAGLVLLLYAAWGALEGLGGRPFEYLFVGPAARSMLGEEPAP